MGTLLEDISKNFSRHDWNEYPLTADKFARWLANTPKDEQVTHRYELRRTSNCLHPASTGIFDFMRALPDFILKEGLEFMTPSEAINKLKPKDKLVVPDTISWSEEEKNIFS